MAGAVYLGIFVAQGSRWQPALASVFVNVASAAALGAPVILVCRRLPPSLGWRRTAGLHLLLAVLFSVAWLGAVDLGLSVVASARAGEWTPSPLGGFAIPWQLFAGLMVYAATAAAATAARDAAALAEQRERTMRAESARVRAESARVRAESARVRAELDALHARFQPHFLFNSLHGIATLVRHDAARGADALEGLGELLRATLRVSGGGADEHSLAAEWRIVGRYVELERLRLGERLRLEACLSPDALDCLVPPFLLQPLVENAIHHAVEPSTHGATVRVQAEVDGRTLRVRVADDGPGAPNDDPGTMGNGTRTRGDAREAAGMGLALVRERLATLYRPGDWSVDIRSGPGEGFCVETRLPARRGGGDGGPT